MLEEASRGILTTPEHEREAKILRGSVIEKMEKKSATGRVPTVWYAFRFSERKPKFRYEQLPNGSVREVPVLPLHARAPMRLVLVEGVQIRADALARSAAVALSGCKQLPRFFRGLGFNAPLLGAEHVHRGVEGLEFGFDGGPAHLSSNQPRLNLNAVCTQNEA